MAGTGALLMALLVLSPNVLSLPLPEERDSEDSRKVLGSSVVTSVSVVLDDTNGTATAHFADAAGRPVGRPLGGDDIGSPVGLLTPDRYQFFTFDADGNLVKRFMTKDEVRSIIANGQKKGEAPTFYHNAPTGEGIDASELVVGHSDEHSEQMASQLKVHRVVESVQNVLKSQLVSAPASDLMSSDDLPSAPDPGASWSMILPSYLGNIGEDHESPLESPHSDTASTESLMVGDAPIVSTEIGSGEKEHEDATEGGEKTEETSEEDATETASTSEEMEQATEKVNEPVKEEEQVTEQVQEEEYESTTGQDKEEEQEQATEQANEQEQATEQVKEQEQVTEQVKEQEQSIEEVEVEQATENVEEQEHEQATEHATETVPMLLDDEPEDVSESTEDELTTPQVELNSKQESPDDADVAGPTTVPSDDDVAETTYVSELSSSTTEEASTTSAASTSPVKLPAPASDNLEKPVVGSDEMHADAPVISTSEEASSETSSTEQTAGDKGVPSEASEEDLEEKTAVTELTTEAEATTDIQQQVELLEPVDAEEEVPVEMVKEKESLASIPAVIAKEKESIESVPAGEDLSASVATSDDKSANNMVDTTSTLSSEVRHPSDVAHETKQSVEQTHPEVPASEAVSVEEVTAREDATTEVDDAESTDAGVSTTLATRVEEALTNATLMDLNVTQTLGDALSSVLRRVAEDALSDTDADADADDVPGVVVTSVSSSHSAHSTSTSVSSSKESEASAASVEAADKESVDRVEELSTAEGDDKDKVKRHNKPVKVVEEVEFEKVPLIQLGDSGGSDDSDDVATLRPSSTEGPASGEYIPISVEMGAVSAEEQEPEVEDVKSKAGSGDGEAEGSGDDDDGSGDGDKEGSGGADFGEKPAHDGLTTPASSQSGLSEENSSLYDVNKYANSDKDLGVTTPSHDADELNDASLGDNKSTTTEQSSENSSLYDVNKYANSDKDLGVTTPSHDADELNDASLGDNKSTTTEQSSENSSLYDVNKYANSDKDLGVTTPSHDADELNDASLGDNKSTTTEQSSENSSLYDVNKYANSDKDVGVTTPSHDADELNDASLGDNKSTTTEQSSENSSLYDVNKYANSDKDVGVTTPSHDADELNDASLGDNKSTTTEQSSENSSLYDVNKYANSDKDLGVTTPSHDADELNDASSGDNKSTTTEQSSENSSLYDVNKYANSDKDLGVTEPSHDADVEELNDEGSSVNVEDLYDVHKYVNSDNDLGVTTPISESTTELTPSTSQETVKSEEATTTSTEGSAEGSTTHSDSEMMLNDEPQDEDDNADSNNLFKSPLAGVVAPSWTPVAVISPHDTAPGLVDLRPAPGESLGLEASTANLFKDVHNFAALCNELAFRMWLSATGKGVSAARSLVMSPFAITSLLSMIFLGAKGPTSGQMNDILRLDDMMTFNPHQVFRNVTESLLMEKPSGVATAAFVRQLYSDKNKGRMLDFYKQRVSGFYDGHVEEVDFKTIGDTVRRRTNMLVKKQTGGKIAEYMRGSNLELQPPLAAFGANVFQTDCSSASSVGRNGEMYFTVLPATRHRRLVPVPAVVYRSGFLAGYEPSLDATVVSLGGGDAEVSTLLVLPGQQGQLAPGDGLPLLEARLFAAPFADAAWSKLLRSLLPRVGLEVQLPRFSHRSQLNMTRSLQTMGLNDLFDPSNADLKGLSGSSGDLHVSDIVQINTFSTCAEAGVGAQHHVEIYPGTPQRAGRDGSDAVSGEKEDLEQEDLEQEDLENVPLALRPRQARIDLSQEPDALEESVYQMPLALRPRQAREPEEENLPRLKFDRPFLYFVRHNPTGFILHMGRFNPRLLN